VTPTTRQPLTGAELDALFAGALAAPSEPKAPVTTSPARRANYDRCAGCKSIVPALLSFSGDTDWSPSIPLDDPLRAEIKALRRSTGRRTILICSPCIDERRNHREAVPASSTIARLFEP